MDRVVGQFSCNIKSLQENPCSTSGTDALALFSTRGRIWAPSGGSCSTDPGPDFSARRSCPTCRSRRSPQPFTPALSLIHISEPTRLRRISYAVFCLKKKKTKKTKTKSTTLLKQKTTTRDTLTRYT